MSMQVRIIVRGATGTGKEAISTALSEMFARIGCHTKKVYAATGEDWFDVDFESTKFMRAALKADRTVVIHSKATAEEISGQLEAKGFRVVESRHPLIDQFQAEVRANAPGMPTENDGLRFDSEKTQAMFLGYCMRAEASQ